MKIGSINGLLRRRGDFSPARRPDRLTGWGWLPVMLVWVVSLPCSAQSAGDAFDRSLKLEYDQADREWVAVEPPPLGTAQGDHYAARAMVRDGNYKQAVKALTRWQKVYGEDDADFPAVLTTLSRAQTGLRDYEKAHETLQRFLERFDGTEHTREALRQEFVIAEVFLSGVKRKVWGLRILPSADVGLRILDDISTQNTDRQLAEFAVRTKADYFMRIGDHAMAQLEYARLLTEYPQSRYYSRALFEASVAALATYAGTDYDKTPLIEARSRFADFQRRYPEEAGQKQVGLKLQAIRQEEATRDFGVGQYYERSRHFRAAVFCYNNVVEDWPDTIAAARATARLDALSAFESSYDSQPRGTGDVERADVEPTGSP